MRCTAYCTASSYNINALFAFLSKHHEPVLYRNVIHREHQNGLGDVFYFGYGSIVCWGLSEEEEQNLFNEIKIFEIDTLTDIEHDEFTYSYGHAFRIYKDEITLPTKQPLSKLAISHGLAQSVKLTIFEQIIQETIDKTKFLPEQMAKKGKIPLSRNEISKKMGELFIERNSINLHSEILETPEFFWEYPELEPLYTFTRNYLDISTRIDVLNKRLGIVHELFEILADSLQHQHSSSLEWIIIWLIAIEILLSIVRDLIPLI
jgi:uncharacterized Rmd1/YagE family protein